MKLDVACLLSALTGLGVVFYCYVKYPDITDVVFISICSASVGAIIATILIKHWNQTE